MATWILEERALPEDRERIEAVIVRALAESPWEDGPACVCGDLKALERAGTPGSRAILDRIFRETADQLSRTRAAEMMAATPNGLPSELAVEGLWDGCDSIRAIAAKAAPLDAPGVRERLETLASRDPADEEAAVVAVERLKA
jgi:hypothetical protein